MILVTGSNGQLGSELKLLLSSDQALFVDRQTCDITNIQDLEKIILANNINAIVNCAAYTAVDLAESEASKAYEVNEKGSENIALIAKKYLLNLIHVSTDYVFDGKFYSPIDEQKATNPVSIYGKSKLAGEKKIQEINPNGIIIRTSWLYSRFGKNFVKTITKAGSEREFLKVVYDQVGSPTNAEDLAQAIIKILPQIKSAPCEIYHFSNEGVASWYDFAQAIKEIRKLQCKIYPIKSSEYPLPAPRPFYSVLAKNKIKEKFNLEIPYWKESLVKLFNSADITF